MISPEKWDAPNFYNCQFCAHSIYILAKTLVESEGEIWVIFLLFSITHSLCKT